jgi:hypothetical protein
MDLLVLFMSAFAASTILPMSSEVVLGAVAGATDVWRPRWQGEIEEAASLACVKPRLPGRDFHALCG